MGFKEINTNVWTPEKEGDVLEGVYVQKKDNVGAHESTVYYVESEEKGIQMVWGSTVLDDRMGLIPIGSLVRITFKGTKPSKKGKDLKIFKVEADESTAKGEKPASKGKSLLGSTETPSITITEAEQETIKRIQAKIKELGDVSKEDIEATVDSQFPDASKEKKAHITARLI